LLSVSNPVREEMRFFVWGTWTEELEDYCTNDVEVTNLLMQMAELRESSDDAIWVQHMLTDLMCRQQESGFFFDVESALELKEELTHARNLLGQATDRGVPRSLGPCQEHRSVSVPRTLHRRGTGCDRSPVVGRPSHPDNRES
jgi:hypothetical protein